MKRFAVDGIYIKCLSNFSVAKFLKRSFTEEKNSMAQHDKNNT